jgi:hypothetical protein
MEDLEKRAIEDLPVVSSVRFHAGDTTHKAGVYVNLRCSAASSHGGCGAKQVGPVRMSSKYPTLQDCLRELGRLIRQDHGPTCVAAAHGLQAAEKDAADASTKRPADQGSLNATEVLLLNTRLKMIQERTAQANKATLDAEKERDEIHNQIEQIEQRLHPKRARSHEDGDGDAHEMLPEVDNWDLRVHRQQAMRVQNRWNVQVGSRENQPKPRTGTDGFFYHSRPAWSGGLDFVLVLRGRCSGSPYTCGVDQHARSHGARQ